MAATITVIDAKNIKVEGAHGILVNIAFSPDPNAAKMCVFSIDFPVTAATNGRSMGSTLKRDLPVGYQTSTIVVSEQTMTPVTVPLGVFPGRRVSYKVTDKAPQRTVQMTIISVDGTGIDEVWHHEFTIIVGPKDVETFNVKEVSGNMTITSVDATLPPP